VKFDEYIGLPQFARETDPKRHCYRSYMDRAVERVQLEECVKLNDETVDHLYGEFSVTTTDYVRGTRPLLEMIVDTVCADCKTDTEKAVSLVKWRRSNYRHVAKCGLGSEEEILLGGYSMCHDASRSLIVLCQVAGLGARMILGLNEEREDGHTLVEAYFGGKWALLDPSPCVPFPFYELEDGTFANSRDIQKDPTICSRCKPDFESPHVTRIPTFFADCCIANYPIEESTRYMAIRFLRLATAMKIVENYDYTGHLCHPSPASYTDLDDILGKWVQGTMHGNPPVTH